MTTRTAWWRPPLYDVGLWLLLLVWGEQQYLVPGRGRIIPHPAVWVPLWVVVTVPVLWRRAHPWLLLWVWVVGGAAEALYGRGTGTFVGFVLLVIAAYTVARYELRFDRAVAGFALILGTLIVHDVRDPTTVNRWSQVLSGYAMLLLVSTAGRFIRARTVRLQTLEIEVADHARQRDELARAAVAAERARIARELHDVIAHSVSVVIVQAVATLGELDDRNIASTRTRVGAIEEIARQALADMRRLVAIGDDGGDRGDLGPQPGVDSLPALVAGVADAGVHVDLEIAGKVRPLPAGVGLTLYRLAQEALTNAVNHAPGATVKVQVTYQDTAVDLEVSNGASTAPDISPRGGNGLVGMRERTALYGGTLAVGPRHDGGFAVHASLPLESALT